ncbi:hypothetical protein [Dermatobacter hominis]|uniref:hypothetical protein n=1 Tax=Dermatobacter hominis TaxID=2884263 RepID=UPI001D124129|nr:hypothetical protein [Dermatobacter hominis]UDY34021.1 hypothetical protein LH044_11765 [Dermatobacter hominis]
MGWKRAAVALMAAGITLTSAACADDEPAEPASRQVENPSAVRLGAVQLAVDSAGHGWVLDLGPGTSGQVVDVYEMDGADFASAPAPEPMRVAEAVGVDGRLVISGSRCVDAEDQSDTCNAVGEVRVLDDGSWQSYSFESDPGDPMQNTVTIMGAGPSPATVWLKVGFSPDGSNDGAIRAVLFDVDKMRPVEWTEPSPALGATCLMDGSLVDYNASRVLPPSATPGQVPGVDDPLPVTYQVFTYRKSGWEPAANGSWTGERARVEDLHCTPYGLSTSNLGSPTPVLGWTPDGGWTVTAPQLDTGARGGPPAALVTGQPLTFVDGRSWVEQQPGTWVPLPTDDATGATAAVAISGNHVATCPGRGHPPLLSACTVRKLQ